MIVVPLSNRQELLAYWLPVSRLQFKPSLPSAGASRQLSQIA
ncbi:MAG: hypothetical protein JWP47_2107 [Polaromonas sp.]|jgi:hypothetical protein|nr:hypothetical protein [Polaromonas sp.]